MFQLAAAALNLRRMQRLLPQADADVKELSEAIQHDDRKMGSGVRGWISRNAGKVLDHGVQATISVGTAILTQLIKKHLGLP